MDQARVGHFRAVEFQHLELLQLYVPGRQASELDLLAGVLGSFIASAVFNFQNGPSYRCMFPFPPRSEKILESGKSGILGSLVGTIGTIQAGEVIKIITGFGEILSGKVLIFDMKNNSSYKYVLNRNDENFDIDGLINYEEYCKPSL